MSRKPNEKLLGGDIDSELLNSFLDSIPDGFKKKHVLSAAVSLWLRLPEEDRNAILLEQQAGGDIDSLIYKAVQRVLAERDEKASAVRSGAKKQRKTGQRSIRAG